MTNFPELKEINTKDAELQQLALKARQLQARLKKVQADLYSI